MLRCLLATRKQLHSATVHVKRFVCGMQLFLLIQGNPQWQDNQSYRRRCGLRSKDG